MSKIPELCPRCRHSWHSINGCPVCGCEIYGGTPGPQKHKARGVRVRKKVKIKKGDLIVEFKGFYVVKKADIPDDHGSFEHWLLNAMDDALKYETTDDSFDALNLSIEVRDAR